MTIKYADNTHDNYDNVKAFEMIAEQLGQFEIEDASYKNDSCPSMIVWIDQALETYIQLHIDYKDAEMREDYEMSEFYVSHYHEGDMIADKCINDADEAIDFITELMLELT
jgi:hypothetical protein